MLMVDGRRDAGHLAAALQDFRARDRRFGSVAKAG